MMVSPHKPFTFDGFTRSEELQGSAERVGFRFGARGTHTSRTLMLEDLVSVLGACGGGAGRADYTSAIVDENCLLKPTTATRRSSRQRLAELYALDPAIPLFRILRRLWDLDQAARPLFALLVALARDPLLRATAAPVIALRVGDVLTRPPVIEALRSVVGERLNDSILDKVARNAASSWTKAGHLTGRTHKTRRSVRATPAAVAFALYLGEAAGFRGDDLLSSGWLRVLDADSFRAKELAIEARRIGLIDLSTAGEVLSLSLDRLDPWYGRR
jgi:hypothetical protein